MWSLHDSVSGHTLAVPKSNNQLKPAMHDRHKHVSCTSEYMLFAQKTRQKQKKRKNKNNNAIIAKVQASCGTQLLWRGKHHQKADLLRAMFAHTKELRQPAGGGGGFRPAGQPATQPATKPATQPATIALYMHVCLKISR